MLKFLSRYSAMVLSVIMIILNVCACNNFKTPQTSGKVPTHSNKTEPVTIDWLAYNTYGQPNTDAPCVKQIEEWFNIKVNFWYVDDQRWDQVLGVKLASGEMPDVMKIKNTNVVMNYVNQGVLAPITNEMKKKLPAIFEAIDKYGGSNQLIDGMVEGKLYVLKQASVMGSYPTVLVWRTDWLKNVGINKMPETIAEWEDAMYRFRNNDPDRNGKNDTYGMSNTAINAIFGAYGAIPLKEFRGRGTQNLFWTKRNGRYVFAATQPEVKGPLELLAKWYQDGVIDPEFVTGENISGNWALSQAFNSNKIGVTGMTMASHWNPALAEGMNPGICYTDFMNSNPEAKLGETFDIGKPPEGPEGKSGTYCWGAFQTMGIGFTSKLSENPEKMERVLDMLNTLSTDFDKWAFARYGVLGENYAIDTASGEYMPHEKYTVSGELEKAGIYVFTPLSIPEFQRKVDPLGFSWAGKYKSSGYSDVLVPQTEAAARYTEDLKKFTLESYIQIITGQKPSSYFNDFVKTFKANGGAEIERQVNEVTENLVR